MKTKMKARYLGWLIAAVAGVLTADVQASELLGLLEVLRDNGTITQAQYQRLRDEAIQGSGQAGAQPTQVAADKAPAKPLETVPAADRKPDVETKFGKTGGLTWKDPKRGYELELGGRLLLDAVSYRDDEKSMGSGTELRAARISLKGSLAEHWKFKAQYDFADDLSVKDVFLRYQGFRHLDALTIGQFKEPFSLEEQTSSKHITFMERALPVDTFSPGRALGLGIDKHGKSWGLSAGLFAEAVGEDQDDNVNEGWGMAGRGTWALLRGDRRSLHLGAAVEHRVPDSDGEVKYRAGPESHLTEVDNLVKTGDIEAVDNTLTLGLEAALVQGPFSLQGEYIRASVERDGGMSELDFDGWYIFASWLLTGESRPYSASNGAFDRIIPRGEWGAWELALRYSTLDLNDRDILGGEANSTTLGLNWYINPRIRFMANYIRMESEREGVSDDPDIFQLRSQLVF